MHVFSFGALDPAWVLAASDFSPDTAPPDVSLAVRALPAPLTGAGTVIGATNRSDDVFVYVRRRLAGLPPGAALEAHFELTIAATVPQGCIGVGGAPGESVFVKAGAATAEPVPVAVGGEILLSVDKGNQSNGGPAAAVLGNLTGAGIDCEPAPAVLKTMRTSEPIRLTVGPDGNAWAFVGYDSGFESYSELMLVRLVVELQVART